MQKNTIQEFRAIVNLDLKGFSSKSRDIDKLLSPLAVLELQNNIRDYIINAINVAKTSELPYYGFSGGDNSHILYRHADDAFIFVETLNELSKRAYCEDHTHHRMLFHAGAHYGNVAYEKPPEGKFRLDLNDIGGADVSIAARPSAASGAGQFIVTKEFFQKLSLENQSRFGKAFVLGGRHKIESVRSVRFLSYREASDIGDVGFPTNDVIYPAASWQLLWSLLMTGSSFYTINYLTPDQWENNDHAKFGVAVVRNVHKSFSTLDTPAVKRIFLLDDDEDENDYATVFGYHKNIPIRVIRHTTFKQVMSSVFNECGISDMQLLPFSLSTPLFQTDFHDNRIVASYAYTDEASVNNKKSRKLQGVHITGADAFTQLAFVRAYTQLWNAAENVTTST